MREPSWHRVHGGLPRTPGCARSSQRSPRTIQEFQPKEQFVLDAGKYSQEGGTRQHPSPTVESGVDSVLLVELAQTLAAPPPSLCFPFFSCFSFFVFVKKKLFPFFHFSDFYCFFLIFLFHFHHFSVLFFFSKCWLVNTVVVCA